MSWHTQGMSIENAIDRLEVLIGECDRTLKNGIHTGHRNALHQTYDVDYDAMQRVRNSKMNYTLELQDLKTEQLNRKLQQMEKAIKLKEGILNE